MLAYEQERYTVRAVELTTPIPTARPAIPAIAGQAFTLAGWQQGQRDIAAAGDAKGLRLVLPSITGCDAGSKTLVVVYRLIAIPDPTRVLKFTGLNGAGALVPTNVAASPAPRCWNLGLGLPVKTASGPNYTYTASVQADSCGPLGIRNQVQLYYPAVTSSYVIHPGKTTHHDFDTVAAGWVGPLTLDGRITSTMPERRYAVRFSAAMPMWRRSLVPKDVLKESSLGQAVTLALTAARSVLQDSYVADSAAFREIAGELATVQEILTSLPPLPARSKARITLQAAVSRLNAAIANGVLPTHVRGLAIDYETGAGLPPVAALLTTLLGELQRLEKKNPEFAVPTARLERLLYDINERFRQLEASRETLKAAQRAHGEMRDAKHVLDSLLERGSLYAASPVFLMNATDRLPFAIGSGVRVTLLAVDVTVGYTWSVHPKEGRPRGAVTASFDLTHLFR